MTSLLRAINTVNPDYLPDSSQPEKMDYNLYHSLTTIYTDLGDSTCKKLTYDAKEYMQYAPNLSSCSVVFGLLLPPAFSCDAFFALSEFKFFIIDTFFYIARHARTQPSSRANKFSYPHP